MSRTWSLFRKRPRAIIMEQLVAGIRRLARTRVVWAVKDPRRVVFLYRRGLYCMSLMRDACENYVWRRCIHYYIWHTWNSRLFAMHLDAWSFRTRHGNALRKIILDFFSHVYVKRYSRDIIFDSLLLVQKLFQINSSFHLTMKLCRATTIIIVS